MSKFTISQKIVLMAMALIIVIILYLVVKNVSYNLGRKKIDYKNITGETLVNRSTLTNSKAIYFSLSDVITRYVSSYRDTGKSLGVVSDSNNLNYKEYYSIVIDDYKKYLGKNEYDLRAQQFLDKFVLKTFIVEGDEPMDTMDIQKIIKGIYVFSENMYICKLKSDINKQDAYIGIELNPNNSKWYIFYLE